MASRVTGEYPVINRVRTGLVSLDLALSSRGAIGMPMRTIVEIYGHPNVGKSTLSYYLAGMLAREQNGVVPVCDLEMLDRDYLARTFDNTGFDGEIRLMDSTNKKGEFVPHEDMLMAWTSALYTEDSVAAVLDSIGGIQPMAEANGDFGEAFMGRRAKLVAQVVRQLTSILRNKKTPGVALIVNHVHGILGGKGHASAGGETLHYHAATRIMMWTKATWTVSDDDPTVLGFQVQGQTEKLRFGGKGRKFQFYIVPGYGVHAGASALMDCLELGLAESKATVKLDGKPMGRIKKDFLSYAAEGKTRKFEPFQEALEKYVEDNKYAAIPADTDAEPIEGSEDPVEGDEDD